MLDLPGPAGEADDHRLITAPLQRQRVDRADRFVADDDLHQGVGGEHRGELDEVSAAVAELCVGSDREKTGVVDEQTGVHQMRNQAVDARPGLRLGYQG